MKKEFSYLVLIVLIANLVLFAFQLIDQLLFWGIIISGALYAYKILPRLRK